VVAESGEIGLRLALLDDEIWRRTRAGEHHLNYPLRLFVSYKWGSADENARVARVADALSARGWDVVFDRYRDESVDRTVEEFVSRIVSCAVFVAVATPAYIAHGMNPVAEARWVFDEVQAAMSSELGLYRIALTPDGRLAVPELDADLPLLRRSDTTAPFGPGIPAIVTATVQEPRFDEIHRFPDEEDLDGWLDERMTYRGPRLTLAQRAALLAALERADSDVDALRALTREHPFAFEVWRTLVLRLTAAGQLDEAVDALTRAIESVHPWDNRLLLERERIDLLNQLGRPREAVTAAIALVASRPSDWVGHFYVGNHLDDCDELWGARNHLLLACRDRFAEAEAFNTLGIVYLGLGFLLRARQSFEAALRRDASLDRAARNLTRAMEAEPPHALAEAARFTGQGIGCDVCPAVYPLTAQLAALCAACGGRRPVAGACPYCGHDVIVPAAAGMSIRCPTCRQGTLTTIDSFPI
jgi:tetratricopeptide (TPR) repeat protein